MKISCDVISDLMPLVKDGVASEESMKIVLDHLENCESCKCEFENYTIMSLAQVDDNRVLYSIKKKLFIAMALLLMTGASIGAVLNKSISLSLMPIIVAVLSIAAGWLLIFKMNLSGGKGMEKFFIRRAIGTIIVFTLLGIFLFLKYVLHLF